MAYFQAEFTYLHPPALAFSCKFVTSEHLLADFWGLAVGSSKLWSGHLLAFNCLRLFPKNGNDQPNSQLYFFPCNGVGSEHLPQAAALSWATDLALHITGLMKVCVSSQVSVPQETHSPPTGPEISHVVGEGCASSHGAWQERGYQPHLCQWRCWQDGGKNPWIQVLSTPYES